MIKALTEVAALQARARQVAEEVIKKILCCPPGERDGLIASIRAVLDAAPQMDESADEEDSPED
jgi:hypothetical protein